MKFQHSLLAKYLLIIIVALIIWPFVLPAYFLPSYLLDEELKQKSEYLDTDKLKKMWQLEAEKLDGADSEQVDEKLRELKDRCNSWLKRNALSLTRK